MGVRQECGPFNPTLRDSRRHLAIYECPYVISKVHNGGVVGIQLMGTLDGTQILE